MHFKVTEKKTYYNIFGTKFERYTLYIYVLFCVLTNIVKLYLCQIYSTSVIIILNNFLINGHVNIFKCSVVLNKF